MPDAATTTAADAPRTLKYGVLRQQNPEYKPELLQELEDLYVGGYQILDRVERYLPQLVGESPERHKERRECATYQNYFGQIVQDFVSDLFGQPLQVTAAADADNAKTPGKEPENDFYSAFAKDADRRGSGFVEVVKAVVTTSLKKRVGLMQIDAPGAPAGAAPTSKADEDALGLARCYAFELPLERLIDWHLDELGGFRWAILYEKDQHRESPRDVRSSATVETFTIWVVDGQGEAARARWERYEIRYNADQEINDDTDVTLVADGTTSFRRIPILRLDIGEGLWVGNKIGPSAREHFQRRTELVSAERRSMLAIPYIKRGPEIGAPGDALVSETQENPHRGRDPVGKARKLGWVEIGADDEIGFAEPVGGCYDLVDKQLTTLKDEMFRVCHQMAASVTPTPGAVMRSGDSKKEDGASTAKVLRELGNRVRAYAVQVYKTISEARSEPVSWTAHGLDNYQVDDRAEVLEEALQVDLVSIPSVTFKRLYKFQLAKKLVPGADPQTLQTMKGEIDKGVVAEEEERALMREAALAAANDTNQEPDDDEPPGAPPWKKPSGTKKKSPPKGGATATP